MNEDRRRILDMLSRGQITVDEAERLMSALDRDTPKNGTANSGESGPKAKPKYFRVVVLEEEGRGDGAKVNIRVPMQLLRSGVKLASLIPPHARERVNDALHKEGVQIDLNQIKPENLEELIEQLNEVTIDVDDKKTRVRVFCE